MLAVQKYLTDGKSPEDLKQEYFVKVDYHPEGLPLILLNYGPDSPKLHPIVRCSRGLVLELGTWNIVGSCFYRFFNWGEVPEEMDSFNFNNFSVTEKVDGTMCLIYNYKGKWMANTRRTFGRNKLNYMGFKWEDGFCKAMGINNLQELDDYLDRETTYVCEFCSPWNKVVRYYSTPTMFLLGLFKNNKEIDVDTFVFPPIFHRPETYLFNSIEQIIYYLTMRSKQDPTFEGVIIKDNNNNRQKIKSPTYLTLHRTKGEQDNLFHYKKLMEYVISGDSAELLLYFPEVKERFKQVEKVILDEVANACYLYDTYAHLPEREFAEVIRGKTKFQTMLFRAKRQDSHPSALWRKETQVIKRLFRS